VLFEAGGDSSEMLELIEEALDEVAVSVEPPAECRNVHPARHRLDVCPGAPVPEFCAEGVAIVTAIGKQHLARADGADHVGALASVVGLALAQLQCNRVAVGIHHGVDLGGQSATRAPHASGWSDVPSGGQRRTPFLTLAAC
jgi:hypothetical protein